MTVLDQAQNFSGGPVAAARQRDRWARKEANATNDERRAQYREAIADLEARYPDIEDVPIGGAEAFARERGHGTGARSPVHGGRTRQRPGTRKQSRTPSSSPPSTAKPRTSGAKKSRGAGAGSSQVGRPTPRVDRAIRQTGIPAAASSSGSWTMAALGATVGLSLLYLVLSSAEEPGTGAAALPTAIHSVVRFLNRFLDPHEDFFYSDRVPRPKEPTPNQRAEHAGRVPQSGVPRGPRQNHSAHQRGRAR